jgi:UPF0271 protein
MLLNADIGEKELLEDLEHELALIPYLDMLNIACGGHAGNQLVMSAIMKTAKQHGALIGAHPSYPDRKNFGRMSIVTTKTQVQKWLSEQIGLFLQEAQKLNSPIHHIKPHGALYHDVMQNEELADLFMEAIASQFPKDDKKPFIVGLANSVLEKIAQEYTFPFMAEAFIDRRYVDDGNLQSRKEAGSVLTKEEALDQYLSLTQTHTVQTNTGENLALIFQTLCVHSDSPESEEIVKSVSNLRKK